MTSLSSDKALHFLWCYLIASICLPLAIAFAIGKEIFDWCSYGKDMGWKKFLPMTVGDLVADGMGIISFTIIRSML